jgi:cell division septum initiation protein DivIVA
MSIQEFSDGLASLLQDVSVLRTQNEEFRMKIEELNYDKMKSEGRIEDLQEENEKLRKQNKELETARTFGLRLDEISTSLASIRREFSACAETSSHRETILECFMKMLPSDNYDMVCKILEVSKCGVRNAIGGFFVTDAILGKTRRPIFIDIFTFDRVNTVRVLESYKFFRTNMTNYARDNTVCKVHSFVTDKPDTVVYADFLRRTFDSAARVIYDGENFIHIDKDALFDYVVKMTGVGRDALSKLKSAGNHIHFQKGDPTLQWITQN